MTYIGYCKDVLMFDETTLLEKLGWQIAPIIRKMLLSNIIDVIEILEGLVSDPFDSIPSQYKEELDENMKFELITNAEQKNGLNLSKLVPALKSYIKSTL